MQTLILTLICLIIINFMLKETFRTLRSVILFSAVCAVFILFAWHSAIEQTTSQVAAWLANPALMLDTSVILSIEIALQMAFCFLTITINSSKKESNKTIWTYKALRWFPGILIFTVLYATLVALIFSFPGVDFTTISYSFSFAILVGIPLGSYALRQLLPEKEIRLEIFFYSNLFIFLLGVVATVNGTVTAANTQQVDWKATLITLILFVSISFIGWMGYIFKQHLLILKNKNK